MKRFFLLFLMLFLVRHCFAQDELVKILKQELNRNFAVLNKEPVPAYYISYRVYDNQGKSIQSSFGDISNETYNNRNRIFHIVTRVGNHQMDNTREISNNMGGGINIMGGMANSLPLDNNPAPIQMALWQKTDQQYKDAVKRYENVKANTAVKVAAEDKSDDFSVEKPEQYFEKAIDFQTVLPNIEVWKNKIKSYSRVFTDNKEILSGTASFDVELTRKYFVDTDGVETTENRIAYRISISAATIADDGMNLPLFKSWFAHDLAELPSDEQVIAEAEEMSKMLSALRKAPVVESFSGPALMTAEAAGVFFHEIFGHRVEGARLKKEADAQTFKKKVGEMVLPADISVIFDPQIKKYKGIPLNGDYKFDDEGVRGQRVEVVKNGKLECFLMSRTPIDGFSHSNGHGRAMIQLNTVTRQSNMIIESTNPKTQKELRTMLIDEAKKTGKEYGYLFDDVSGGFTSTGRYMPNAFNVTPLVVYRIYADGRPDELVRGVDLVGTPLAMFSQIAACGDDVDVFNGFCGAESGSLPVACVSPTIFVKMVETQKKAKSQIQPPMLERP